MRAAEFNRLVQARREDPEQLAALETLYLKFIHRAGRRAVTELRSSTQKVTVGAGWQPPPEGVLFDPDQTANKVTDAVAATQRRIFWSVAGAPLARAGIAWDVKNPFARHFLDGLGKRTGVMLGQAVQPVIQETVTDAYDRGLSVPDTAALISEKVLDAAPYQARMLARTDLNGLANGASVMAATLVGVQYKQWLTAEDDKVRETHAEADGQTVPVDQPFDVGGESLDYPGDPAGSDDEVCNCRCTVIYTDESPVPAETASALIDHDVVVPITPMNQNGHARIELAVGAPPDPGLVALLERTAAASEESARVIRESMNQLAVALERLQSPAVTVEAPVTVDVPAQAAPTVNVRIPGRRTVEVIRDAQGDIQSLIIREDAQ